MLGNPLVLLAEDDEDLRNAMAVALRNEGLDVVEVPDGKAVRSYIDGCLNADGSLWPRAHVLITDLRMPGMTGLQLLGYLRETEWPLPVIVVTAFGDPATCEEACRLGARAILKKPVDPDELARLVHALVRPPTASRPALAQDGGGSA